MRARLRKPKPTIGVECQRCLQRRWYRSWDEFRHCRCGATIGTIILGRFEWKDDGSGQARVDAQRAAVRRRQVEASRHGAGRRIRFVFRKRNSMSKFKIVKRATDKVAQAGSGKTGAKVEKTKSGKGQPGSAQGRFIGRTTGLSVAKFQNKTLEDNLKKKLTDEQLVRVWKAEFPNAKSDYTVEIVRGVRSAYNRGKHGQDDIVPSRRVPEFDDDGNALPFRGEASAAKREAKESRQTEAKTTKKKTGKRVEEETPVRKLKKVR